MTAELNAALTSLKAAYDITKALVGLHDSAAIKPKAIELQNEILSAQRSAFDAQEAQSALLQRVRDLEKEVADLTAWNMERSNYQLVEVGREGTFAYELKEDIGSSEPKHLLCPNCYEDGRKSVLQMERRMPGAVEILYCLRCQGEINLTGVWYADTPGPRRRSR